MTMTRKTRYNAPPSGKALHREITTLDIMAYLVPASNPGSKPQTFGVGMAIPRRISFLEESRSRGMANLHSSRIEEDQFYSSGSSRNFED